MGWIAATLAAALAATATATSLAATDYPHHRRGQTKTYNFNIAPGTIAPDGVPVKALLVNGQFPGPAISVNYGDRIVVNVKNGLTEGTSLHYHGLNQKGTPWYDGTPASEVCPIAPGDTFTQSFIADQYGVSFWHSHYSAQHVNGIKGPMLIKGPTSAPYDIDLGVVMLTDWFHQDYHTYIRTENTPPGAAPIIPDSNLINGKGQVNCTLGTNCPPNTPYSTFKFQTGKKHLLQVVAAGADLYQCFSIDGHQLTVISEDYVPVKPYVVDCLSLHQGQRGQVIVEAKQPSNSAWLMRAEIQPGIIGAPTVGNPVGYAVVYYDKADTSKLPRTTKNTNVDAQCTREHEGDIQPATPQAPYTPATTKNIDVTLQPNGSGIALFYQNGQTFRGDYNYPILLLAKLGNTSYPDPDWNVYNFGSNSSVRTVFTNQTPFPHPMHLHGHNFQVIAQGTGTWNGQAMSNNPSRRDTAVLPPLGYLVVQWTADNPGVWPFHCHVAWHSSTGYLFNVLEQPAALKALPIDRGTADGLINVCRNWWKFTQHNVVDQIDSGL